MPEQVIILIPVLNEEASLTPLMDELAVSLKDYAAVFSLLS
jgi:hypothetical protein